MANQGCSRDFETGGARPLSSKKSGGARAQPAHTPTPALMFIQFLAKGKKIEIRISKSTKKIGMYVFLF